MDRFSPVHAAFGRRGTLRGLVSRLDGQKCPIGKGSPLMPRGVLIALNTIALFTLAEGTARFAEWVHPGAEGVTFAYSPYRMLKMTHAPWPLNRDGFRARELETYRDSFLIEFLGGSVCLGVGDDPGETVPELLEDALHQAGLMRVEVLNLCQGGAASAEELAIFIEYGLPLHPQVVLSFDGANDVLHPRPVGDDEAPNLPYCDAQLEARVNGRDALSHLAVARVAARLAGRFRKPAPSQSPPVAEGAILDSYLYHLAAVRTLARAGHAFYAVLFQPTLHLDKPWSPEETAMWRSRRPRDAAHARDRRHQSEQAHRRGVPPCGARADRAACGKPRPRPLQ